MYTPALAVVALVLCVGAAQAEYSNPLLAVDDLRTSASRPPSNETITFSALGLRVDLHAAGDQGSPVGLVVGTRWVDAAIATRRMALQLDSGSPPSVSCGAALRIGMVDTPVNEAHPALQNKPISQRFFGKQRFEPRLWTHGTAVAGLLVGRDQGLLPKAELFVAAALNERSDGSLRLDLLGFMQAMDWMASNQVKVVNLSFETAENPVLSLVLARAAERGLVLMAAAGNGGARARPAHPAAHPDVIAVTAVDRRQRIYRHANRGGYIDFAAPGVNVMTPGPRGLRRQSGTSVAVPFVAAAAAHLVDTGIPARADTVRAALIEQAEDLGPPGHDETFGWGYVDPRLTCE